MNILLDTLAILLIAVTFAPSLPSAHWLVRVWEFPRLQIFSLMLGVFVARAYMEGFALFTSPLLAFLYIALLGCAIYQVFWIIPYTPLVPREVKKCKTPDKNKQISILSSNVYMPNNEFQKLLQHIDDTDPDIVVTLESNKKWQEALAPLNSSHPYQKHCPLENLYGMNLFSKYPLESAELQYLVEDDVPSFKVTFTKLGQLVTVYFIHPKPPSPTENESAKPRDIELDVVGHTVSDYTTPVIVTGDLNDVAWSPTTRKFRKTSGLLDPRIGRGFYNTFHAHYPLVKWPLDHIFHSSDFELVEIKKLADIGSDHYPLLTRLQLK
ncbi:endonuclease [Alteromonas sp. 345S023]|uniref:Endonuclease n=1 Tax=Alteromonas profundi TaxID=2696062 RepID=A0A7X5LJN6_9ALTE|nr:endonuclease/exonuclease/phosphatase family protein [Alteromonas profundi]NDV90590.1 endonuclease [Alteromonas profundi]